ncbi:helix-turn-helix domain-containing protein [Maribacter aurantiacus]|uniref:Helix-turn-helix domain-containing protein n=1 Tax=Maribacter aurantiacus TaxID=1882343 RepID=A0A5R8MBA9_9FLAO|nr:helix-turn-helix domain-containing protein [Maribacter aurantiacus]TLF46861.1 helix-turn-helix domain-containing protein [Maribacter aurantiacus]
MELDRLIEYIPIRHNLISTIMFLGVVQSSFLSIVLLLNSSNNVGLKWLGFSILATALIFLDVYVCYTGQIKYVLFLNDSTEALVLTIGPTLYLAIYCFLKRENVTFKKHWLHFMIPIGYFLSQIPFYLAPISVKYNAYIGAYYSKFPSARIPESFNYSYHYIKDIFDWLILATFLFYTILSLKMVWEEKSRLKEIGVKNKSSKYIFTRNTVIVLFILLVLIFSIFYSFDDDGGDHYLGIFNSCLAFLTTYVLVSESRFFEKSWVADKYETIGQSKSNLNLVSIESYVDENNYFLLQDASLNDLATILKVHPNHISKIINQGKHSNFNDFINQKRIVFSQGKLIDPGFSNLTIEAIGAMAGFKSKSAFYSAFKKHTGTSPSAYIRSFSPKL